MSFKERDIYHAIVKGVHGALNDAGNIPVPGMEDDLYDAVMQLVKERDEAYERAAQICDRFAVRDMHPAECAGSIRALKSKPDAATDTDKSGS